MLIPEICWKHWLTTPRKARRKFCERPFVKTSRRAERSFPAELDSAASASWMPWYVSCTDCAV